MTGLVTHLSFYKTLFEPCSKFHRQKVENFERIFLLQISPTLFHNKTFLKPFLPFVQNFTGKKLKSLKGISYYRYHRLNFTLKLL